MTQPNAQAPVWSLDPAWDNPIVDVNALIGKWSVLLFFNVGCAGCTARAIPFTRELFERHPNINIVGIHTDFESTTSIERLRAVVDYFDLPYPVVRDNGRETFTTYAAEGTPHWIILDTHGRIHRSIFGSLGTSLQRIDYALTEAG